MKSDVLCDDTLWCTVSTDIVEGMSCLLCDDMMWFIVNTDILEERTACYSASSNLVCLTSMKM